MTSPVLPFTSLCDKDVFSVFHDGMGHSQLQPVHDGQYIPPSDIKKTLFHQNHFSFLNLNIRSLNKNFHKIENLLNQLNFSPNIICVTEIWLHETKPFIHHLKGYDFIEKCGQGSAGGVGFFIKENLQYKLVNNINLNLASCEDIWIEIILPKNKKITLGAIYRHPSYNFNDFQENFLKIIDKLSKQNKQFMVGGDLNIDLSSHQNSILSYLNEIHSQGSYQTVKNPTHISHINKNSLIDHNYTNITKHEITTECLAFDISDHVPTLTFIKNIYFQKIQIKKKIVRETRNFNLENFLSELQNKITIINNNEFCDNELWDKFEDTFNLVLNKHAPLRTQTRKECRRSKNPWMTNEILNLIKQKLYNIYLKNPSDSNWSTYKNLRNNITHKIEYTKQAYYKLKIQQTNGNSKKLWQNINEIVTTKNHKQTPQIHIQNDSNNIITDPTQVSNLFNQYFSTVGTELSRKFTPKYSN